MDALRSVLPRKPCAAGSSWSYASSSTIVPPTPSTSSRAPISSGAISCTSRRRFNGIARSVVAQEARQGDGRDDAANDAEQPAGHDREAQRGERREHARLEIAEARRTGDLHELDALQASAQVVRRRAQQDHAAQHGAVEVGAACDREEDERGPEARRAAEARD